MGIVEHSYQRSTQTSCALVTIAESEYAAVQDWVRQQYAARRLKYVGPFCTWRELTARLKREPAGLRLVYQRVVCITLKLLDDRVVSAEVGGPPEDGPPRNAAGATQWALVVARPEKGKQKTS